MAFKSKELQKMIVSLNQKDDMLQKYQLQVLRSNEAGAKSKSNPKLVKSSKPRGLQKVSSGVFHNQLNKNAPKNFFKLDFNSKRASELAKPLLRSAVEGKSELCKGFGNENIARWNNLKIPGTDEADTKHTPAKEFRKEQMDSRLQRTNSVPLMSSIKYTKEVYYVKNNKKGKREEKKAADSRSRPVQSDTHSCNFELVARDEEENVVFENDVKVLAKRLEFDEAAKQAGQSIVVIEDLVIQPSEKGKRRNVFNRIKCNLRKSRSMQHDLVRLRTGSPKDILEQKGTHLKESIFKRSGYEQPGPRYISRYDNLSESTPAKEN